MPTGTQQPTSPPRRKGMYALQRLSERGGVVGLLVGLGIVLRTLFWSAHNPYLNLERTELICPQAAKHLFHGVASWNDLFSLQTMPNYGGTTVQQVLVQPLYAAFGTSLLAWKLAVGLVSALPAGLAVLLMFRLAGRWAGLALAGLLLLPPALLMQVSLWGFGSHGELTYSGLVAVLGMGLLYRRPEAWWPGFLLLGAWLGFFTWFGYSFLVFAAPVLAMGLASLVTRGRGSLGSRIRGAAAGTSGLFIGFVPWLIHHRVLMPGQEAGLYGLGLFDLLRSFDGGIGPSMADRIGRLGTALSPLTYRRLWGSERVQETAEGVPYQNFESSYAVMPLGELGAAGYAMILVGLAALVWLSIRGPLKGPGLKPGVAPAALSLAGTLGLFAVMYAAVDLPVVGAEWPMQTLYDNRYFTLPVGAWLGLAALGVGQAAAWGGKARTVGLCALAFLLGCSVLVQTNRLAEYGWPNISQLEMRLGMQRARYWDIERYTVTRQHTNGDSAYLDEALRTLAMTVDPAGLTIANGNFTAQVGCPEEPSWRCASLLWGRGVGLSPTAEAFEMEGAFVRHMRAGRYEQQVLDMLAVLMEHESQEGPQIMQQLYRGLGQRLAWQHEIAQQPHRFETLRDQAPEGQWGNPLDFGWGMVRGDSWGADSARPPGGEAFEALVAPLVRADGNADERMAGLGYALAIRFGAWKEWLQQAEEVLPTGLSEPFSEGVELGLWRGWTGTERPRSHPEIARLSRRAAASPSPSD